MRARTIIFPFAILLVALAVGWAIQVERESRRLTAQAAAASQRRNDLQKRLDGLLSRLTDLQRQRAELDAQIARAAKPKDEPRELAGSVGADAEARIATDPALHQLYLADFQAKLDATWGLLFAELHLSPARIAQFKTLVEEYERGRLDLIASAHAQRLAMSDPSLQPIKSELSRVEARKMKEFFTPADFQVYAHYNHDKVVEPYILEFASDIYDTDAPLTVAQAQQLTTIFAANSDRIGGLFVRRDTIRWDAAVAQAKAVLSPPQFTALSALAEVNKTSQEIDRIISEARPPKAAP